MPPIPAPGGKLTAGDVAATFGLALLLGLAGIMAAQMLLAVDGEPSGPRRQLLLIAFAAVECFAILFAIRFYLFRVRGFGWPDIGYVPCDTLWLRRGALLGLATLPAAMIVATLIRAALEIETPALPREHIAPTDLSWVAAATSLLYIGLLVPIAEELLFRGVLYGWLRRHLRPETAALCSSAVFGVLHQQPEAMVTSFLVGLALCWLYERSRSVVPCILMHQVFNSLALILAYVGAAAGG